MQFLYGVVATLLVMGGGGLIFIFSGIYNVSARDEHSSIETWALHQTMHSSVDARIDNIKAPDLNNDEMIRRGARAYDSLCVACHLKPGQDSSLIRDGLNPTPPALTKGGHSTPEKQFWVINNGIKMTGMPAWGGSHDEEAIWELTAFLQQLPELSEQEYSAMAKQSGGESASNHDDGHNHEHGDMSAMMTSSNHHEDEAPKDHSSASERHGEPGHHNQDDASGAEDHHTEQKAAKTGADEPEDHNADGHTH